jgi:Site-specific DNA methylase
MEQFDTMIPVTPVKPVAPYVGGKSKLAKLIISHINAIPHNAYCEGFVGMGGIFFRRNKHPKVEVINDYNGEIANLFRILNQHYVPFLDMLKWQLSSRREYNRLIDTRPETLTDLQRAARFLYLQRLAFGGRIDGKNFGVSLNNSAHFNLQKIVPLLENVHKRLSSVVIENFDYKEFIKRYDRLDTLFYLDPPYYGNEDNYGKGLFSRNEFALMADLLEQVKGKFILSLNDRSEIRELFKNFYIHEVSTLYCIQKGETRKANELLISNLPLKDLEHSSNLFPIK